MGCAILKSDETGVLTVFGDEKLFPIVDAPAGAPGSAELGVVTEGSVPITEGLLLGKGRNTPLFGFSRAELAQLVSELGQPAYRARQLEEALYRQWASRLGSVTTLPVAFRQLLDEAGYQVGLPEITETFRSVDGTERYLIAGLDGQTVETVWMPGGDGGEGAESAAVDGDDEEDAAPKRSREPRTLLLHPSQRRLGSLEDALLRVDLYSAGRRSASPRRLAARLTVSSASQPS